jgi:hypothetical protein
MSEQCLHVDFTHILHFILVLLMSNRVFSVKKIQRVVFLIVLLSGIIHWVVRALSADWLTAVYQTVYHLYETTFLVTALITLVTSL